VLRLSKVEGVVPNWRGILENWSDDSSIKVKQLLWWYSCSFELFKEIESLVCSCYNSIDVACPWTPSNLKVTLKTGPNSNPLFLKCTTSLE